MSSVLKNTALSLGKNPEQASAKITAEGAGSSRLLGRAGCSTAGQQPSLPQLLLRTRVGSQAFGIPGEAH